MSNSDEILIVEDSQMQAKRLKKLLQENGFEVVAAHNGKEGLALARERRPALIVSDIVMPEMDGYEMCRALKSDADLQKIPVILLTSLSNPDDVFKGLESGADSYVSKPYDAKVLIDRIRSVKESQSLQNSDSERMLQVRIGAKQYTISSTRQQILNLLLSTYQDAVEQNRILREMRTKLVTVNEELGILVAARTAALEKEKVERKRIEEALASEKERLSVTLRTIADGVITTNTEGTIILMNRAAEELTGWPLEEALGKSVTNIFNLIKTRTRESGELVVENILKSGGLIGFEQLSLVAKDGSERLVAVSGTPIFDMTNIILGIVLVFRDVTVAKRTEEELIKAQKLESLGVLAGGIAHDFNNLLTAILGNISLAKMFAKPGGKVIARLDEAEKASVRAKDLTQQLLTFAKGGAPLKKTTAIADVLRDSAKFALRGSNIKCRFSIPPDLWPVEIDEGQISQVIHNLTINAYQAMPNGGAILLSAANIDILPDQDPGTAVSSGKYVLLSIQDEGHGIPRHLLTRIFDPYFTTKKRGNGLGLATSYSILKNHGGTITVESEIDVGSTFHIYLPVSLKQEHPRKVERQRPIPGTGRVLVMDDEEILRDFVGELLQLLGYDVSFACDGAETIAQYTNAKQTGKAFDCILMDLTIPGGMGGKETIQRLIEIDPAVKAIVSSGYSDDPIMADFGTYGFCGVVAKPYDAKELSEVLQRVIAIPN